MPISITILNHDFLHSGKPLLHPTAGINPDAIRKIPNFESISPHMIDLSNYFTVSDFK